jgi:hypothetical protein
MVDELAECTRSMFWRQHSFFFFFETLATAYISLFGKVSFLLLTEKT